MTDMTEGGELVYDELKAEDDDSVTVRDDMEDVDEICTSDNKFDDSLDTIDDIVSPAVAHEDVSDGLASAFGEWVPIDRPTLADGTLPTSQGMLLSDPLTTLRRLRRCLKSSITLSVLL